MNRRFFSAVGFVQFPILPGAVEENVQQLSEALAQNPPPPGSLILLPEVWATGFDYPKTEQLAAAGPTLVQQVQQLASSYDLYLAGSFAELPVEGGKPWNTLMCIGPEGVCGRWPKQHLFTHWQEDKYYQPGMALPPVILDQVTVGGLVCYDLRFPEIARGLAYHGAQILLVSAQWPKVRLDHWQILLKARAVENQVFIVAANGCGVSGPLELAGHSMVVSPGGEILLESGDAPKCSWCILDPEQMENERRWFSPPGERIWNRVDAQKVISCQELVDVLKGIRQQGAKVAFTNGCFDLLHAGHVSYLEEARQTADCLIVGLNSDQSVRSLNKGDDRPVNTEQERARVLASLGCVDYVVLFSEETPLKAITALMPDVLVKGADWPEDQIVGAREVKENGGRVERIAFTYSQSTTQIIQKIKG